MKQIIGLIILIFGAILTVEAQPTYQWAKQLGGPGSDVSYSIATDAVGNVYTTGFFQSTGDFDPGPGTFNLTSAGSWDIFITKLDASGNFVWAKSIGDVNNDRGRSITIDASGNVYTTGLFEGTVDFDPGAGTFNLSSISSDIFVCKLDASGNFIWAKAMGGSGLDYGYSIATDASGNVLITGQFQLTSDFDPNAGVFNLTSAGNDDIFISKLDASGDFVWAKKIGGTGYDIGNDIALDAGGNVYTTGYFDGTVDFDPGAGTFNLTSTSGSSDVFVSKLDASGNFVFGKKMGGNLGDYGESITIDISGNIFISGAFNGTGDFDPGPGTFNLSTPGDAIFVCKLDVSNNFVWAKQMGGTGIDDGLSITSDPVGNVYTTGYFQNTVDFDPNAGVFNLTSNGNTDIFISKLDALGNFVWAIQIGGTSPDLGRGLVLDGSGNIHITGEFQSTADFDSGPGTANLTSAGTSDIFLAKYASCISAPSTPGSISGNITLCSGSNNTYSVTNDPEATSYTWSLPGGWTGTSTTNSINATASSTSGNITVTANNACGNSTATSLAITVNTIPATPGTISGTATICSGSSNTYTVTNDPSATSYTWTLPGGWTGTSITNSINTTASTTSGNIAVTANNACGNSSPQALAITVNTIPATPGTISGTTTICSGSTNTYSITAVAGATSYTWALPSGWSGTSTTNSINTTASTTSGNITVTANNSCGNSAAATLAITVNTVPALPSTITGSASFCVDATAQTYSVVNDASATSYTWTLPGGWGGTSTTNSINATASATSGNITVTANNGCGSSATQTLAVTVNSLPSVSFTLPIDTICINDAQITLSGGSPTSGTFSGTGVSAGNFYPNAAGAGTHVITYIFTDGNSCTNTATDNIVVDLCLGMNEFENNSLSIYPNPFSNTITIVSSITNQSVRVFNSLGSIVYSTTLLTEKTEIDLSNQERGVYFIQIGALSRVIIRE